MELRWIIVGYAVIAIVFVLSSTFLLLPKISIAAEQEQLQKETSKVVRSYSNQAVTPDVEPDQEMTSQSVGNGKEFNDITKQSSLGKCGIPLHDALFQWGVMGGGDLGQLVWSG